MLSITQVSTRRVLNQENKSEGCKSYNIQYTDVCNCAVYMTLEFKRHEAEVGHEIIDQHVGKTPSRRNR
jgi:hypothetical protein